MLISIRTTIATLVLTVCVGTLSESRVVGQENLSGVPVRFRRATYDAPVTPDAPRESFDSTASQAADRGRRERLTSHVTVAKSDAESPLPLAPPSDRTGRSRDRGSSSGGWRALSTTFSGLAIVLGLFLLVVWLLRRQSPGGPRSLPRDVLEVLGKTTLAPRHELHLIRFGGKLVLIGASADQTQSLTEITESEEVERITAACRQQPGTSVTASFREALSRLDASGSRRGRPQEAADA